MVNKNKKQTNWQKSENSVCVRGWRSLYKTTTTTTVHVWRPGDRATCNQVVTGGWRQ